LKRPRLGRRRGFAGRPALAAAGALGSLGAALAAWALLVEPRRLVMRRVRIASRGWPAGRPPLRVALVSDLHAGGPHVDPEAVARLVERVNRAEPDLVLLLGDFVDDEVAAGDDVAPEVIAPVLAELRAPLGSVAVLGNHDWRYGGERVEAALEAAGVRVLENEAVALDDGLLWVAGVGDARLRTADVRRALEEVPEEAAVILLTHNPDVFPEVPDRVALTVAGHLHGGQVGIPLVRKPVLPSAHGERFARGHVEEGGRHLYVTQGVGEAGYPFRFLAPPEVVVVELRSA
jgi:predicted MPP superfamily phosphohydrolase